MASAVVKSDTLPLFLAVVPPSMSTSFFHMVLIANIFCMVLMGEKGALPKFVRCSLCETLFPRKEVRLHFKLLG